MFRGGIWTDTFEQAGETELAKSEEHPETGTFYSKTPFILRKFSMIFGIVFKKLSKNLGASRKQNTHNYSFESIKIFLYSLKLQKLS